MGELMPELTRKELLELAREKGIDGASMTRSQLLLEVGLEDSDALIYDRATDVDAKRMEMIMAKQEQVPGKTKYYKKDEDEIYKILDKNPWAFNNYDFTNPNNQIVHVFDKKIKCRCGANFKIRREIWVNKEDLELDEIGLQKGLRGLRVERETKDAILYVDPTPIDVRYCPDCGVKYVYHNADTMQEVAV
jgi:hypothetical protein